MKAPLFLAGSGPILRMTIPPLLSQWRTAAGLAFEQGSTAYHGIHPECARRWEPRSGSTVVKNWIDQRPTSRGPIF